MTADSLLTPNEEELWWQEDDDVVVVVVVIPLRRWLLTLLRPLSELSHGWAWNMDSRSQ